MKKIIALAIAVLMIFALAACGEKPAEDNVTELPETEAGDQPAAMGEGPVADDMTPAVDGEAAESSKAPVADGETVGTVLLAEFREAAAAGGTAEEITNKIIANENISFGPVVMPVEPGLLMGFDNAEITGFKEGATFAPMVSTIPFLGYVFVLEDGADAEAFTATLKENANLRWNICTEAEELTIDYVDNYVFFLMSPMSFEG